MIKTNKEKVLEFFQKNPSAWFRNVEVEEKLDIAFNGTARNINKLLRGGILEVKRENKKTFYKMKGEN